MAKIRQIILKYLNILKDLEMLIIFDEGFFKNTENENLLSNF